MPVTPDPSQLLTCQMRDLLRDLGLPISGDKATMVARHKRLVLLEAASSDRETPLPRSDLIRQVKKWEVRNISNTGFFIFRFCVVILWIKIAPPGSPA